MKRTSILSAALGMAFMLSAQTLEIQTGTVTTLVPAGQASYMPFSDSGRILTVCGKDFQTADISQLTFSETAVNDSTVYVQYNGTAAAVVMPAALAAYLTVDVDGANVSILQGDELSREVTYELRGASDDGSFSMDGKLKATVVLNGLSLTSADGAPIDIANGKRINVVLANETVNTLADAASGLQKACFFVNGHAEFSGGGVLNITGNAKHGYRSDEYTELKKSFTGTINILSAVSDGMHVEQYFEMKNGTVNIANVGADGLDVPATTDSTDVNNGRIFFEGGVLNVTTDGDDVKTVKADSVIIVSAGEMNLTCNGDGAKGMSCKGTVTIDGGKVVVSSLGGIFDEDLDTESKPNGIKASGSLTINGGEVYVVAKNKALNTDLTNIYINGGTVLAVGAKAAPAAKGNQAVKVYSKQKIAAGATLTYGQVSYTVPSKFSLSNASVLVSPSE